MITYNRCMVSHLFDTHQGRVLILILILHRRDGYNFYSRLFLVYFIYELFKMYK